MIDKEIKYFIILEAEKEAKDKEFYFEIIRGRIVSYINVYIDFVDKNIEKLKKYLKKEEQENKFEGQNKFKYKHLRNLFIFLNSGTKLLKNEYKTINQETFENYKTFSSKKKSEEWNDFVTYANDELKLKDIKKLHDYLQFIIALFKIEEIRIEYLKEILIKTWNENELKFKNLKEKEKLFESSDSFKEQIQNNYFSQIANIY